MRGTTTELTALRSLSEEIEEKDKIIHLIDTMNAQLDNILIS
jgi:hypothetical protein